MRSHTVFICDSISEEFVEPLNLPSFDFSPANNSLFSSLDWISSPINGLLDSDALTDAGFASVEVMSCRSWTDR